METPETIRTSLQAGEWVTSIDFKNAYFHIPINSQSRKYICFQVQDKIYQFKALLFGLSTAPPGVYSGGRRGQISGNETGYKNSPVPRRLVGQSQIPPNLSATHTNLGSSLSRFGLASERGKIRAGTHTGLQLCRLPVRSEKQQGSPKPRMLASPTDKDAGHYVKSSVSGLAFNVLDQFTDCHRETGTSGLFTYETHSVASQKQLESTRNTGKDHPHSQLTPPTSKMVAGGKQCDQRSTTTSTKTCSADLYRCIKINKNLIYLLNLQFCDLQILYTVSDFTLLRQNSGQL